jgi:hypothetical protein
VTLRGLAIDWHPLPFTQGTIVAVDPDRAEFGTFDWLLTGGFPSPLAPPLAELATRGIVFPSRRKGVDNVHYRDLDQLSEDTFRFHLHARGLSQHVRLLQDGDRFVPTIQGREQPAGNAIAFHSSVGCQLEQISIYTSPRAGVISSSSTGVETRQSVISPPAGSDRWVSIAPYHTRVLG